MKNIIKNFLIWLNTPRCIDIPVFGESKDAELYDDLYRQKERLERRKQRLISQVMPDIQIEALRAKGYLLPPSEAWLKATVAFETAKENGLINEFNELVRPKEAS